MNKIMIMGLLLAVPAIANADDEKAVEPAPQWYLAEIQKLSAGSGRWVADNSAYQTDTEPYESYVTEWVASFDGTTLRGRLFGIVQGEETPNFWEFRQYWHPGRAEVVIEQFGGQGAVGIGTMQMDNGKIRSDQSFWFPGGSTTRTGHISFFDDATTHVTESFDIVDDDWIPRRKYTWEREDVDR